MVILLQAGKISTAGGERIQSDVRSDYSTEDFRRQESKIQPESGVASIKPVSIAFCNV